MFGSKITKKLKIEGMHCAHCANTVEIALKEIPGVKSAKVNLEEKTAQIISKEEIEESAIEKAIEEAGFKVVK